MSLFDQIVDDALKNQRHLSPLRRVVEKELLHHDILRVLNSQGLLAQLTFMGGTCLRACYGSNRLSEDLDFTGGAQFKRQDLAEMARLLVTDMRTKYDLEISISEPVRESGNVDTWKLKVQTNAGLRDFPAQRINIDVCAIPSYQAQAVMLRNIYDVEMGTSGLILLAQSREEIYCDKLLAFALRPNRIKHRDCWDLAWLHQQTIQPAFGLLAQKLRDHQCSPQDFLDKFLTRVDHIKNDAALALEFRKEMQRFLPAELVTQTVDQPQFWNFLGTLMQDLYVQSRQVFSDGPVADSFQM